MDGERERKREGGWVKWAISGGKRGLADKKASLQTSSARQDNHQLISPEAEREKEVRERNLQRERCVRDG